jgi:hypothetical protein
MFDFKCRVPQGMVTKELFTLIDIAWIEFRLSALDPGA